METPKKLSFTLLAALFVSACATTSGGHDQQPTSAQASDIGMVMAKKDGMTLYTFAKDQPGVSACYDGCAQAWPPFTAGQQAQDSGAFTVIDRSDGTRQWAYEDQPLYTWQGDKAPGDVNGHGIKGVWFTVKAEQAQEQSPSRYSRSKSYY